MKGFVAAAGTVGTALVLLANAAPARAQQAPAPVAEGEPESGDAPPPVATEGADVEGARRYTPADFARFAPRNALDMLENVPGFAIDEGDTERRGLGQATGNVLINGERFSGKSTDIRTELQRISASNVARIEIVDGATLSVAGLSGQVANVVTLARGLSGNFAWRPQTRTRITPLRLLNGEVSVSGSAAGFDYSLSLRNNEQRNGNSGPELVYRPDGSLVDERDERLVITVQDPTLSGTLRRTFANGSVLNLNGQAALYHSTLNEISLRSGPGQPDRDRRLAEQEREYNYEFGGDYEFGLGGGRLKFIGLRSFEHSPFRQLLVQTFADNRPTEGSRFTQVADETETILRSEYRWRAGGGDWQASLEGAFNKLDIENALFSLDPVSGDFVPAPLPNATGQVEEQRAEATLTYGRPLSPTLTMQASAGVEYSRLSQSGPNGLTRTFYRPKGSLSLAWRPQPELDVSARIERVVGQLNFYDFVASANISAGTENSGNANLVPPQSWDGQVQATRNLGPWGTATARLYFSLISDVVDFIPIGATGQSRGNLDGIAKVYGVQWTSTFNFDPLGWRGAKLDLNLQFQRSSLEDPLTGMRRSLNYYLIREMRATLRHDIPNSDWAYGANAYQYRQAAEFRLDQRSRFVNIPADLGLFVEHKDVAGLTVRAAVDNLLGINETFNRTFHDGRRTNPILFTEARDRFYGPVFTLTISGTI